MLSNVVMTWVVVGHAVSRGHGGLDGSGRIVSMSVAPLRRGKCYSSGALEPVTVSVTLNGGWVTWQSG